MSSAEIPVGSIHEVHSTIMKASLSSSAPVTTRTVTATDKEREKLLYPGRVNLTSLSSILKNFTSHNNSSILQPTRTSMETSPTPFAGAPLPLPSAVQSSVLVSPQASNTVTHSVLTPAHIPSTVLSPSPWDPSHPPINQTIAKQSPQCPSRPSLHGQTRRRSFRWTRGAIWCRPCSAR